MQSSIPPSSIGPPHPPSKLQKHRSRPSNRRVQKHSKRPALWCSRNRPHEGLSFMSVSVKHSTAKPVQNDPSESATCELGNGNSSKPLASKTFVAKCKLDSTKLNRTSSSPSNPRSYRKQPSGVRPASARPTTRRPQKAMSVSVKHSTAKPVQNDPSESATCEQGDGNSSKPLASKTFVAKSKLDSTKLNRTSSSPSNPEAQKQPSGVRPASARPTTRRPQNAMSLSVKHSTAKPVQNDPSESLQHANKETAIHLNHWLRKHLLPNPSLIPPSSIGLSSSPSNPEAQKQPSAVFAPASALAHYEEAAESHVRKR